MQITADYLADMKARAEGEQRRLLAQLQQAVGAIAMLDAMAARLKEDEPALEAQEPQP